MADFGQGERDEIITRLRRVEGQVRGIQRMIEDGRDCEEIVTQLMAARAALDRASILIINSRIERCLLDATGQGGRAQLERLVSFLLKISPTMSPTSEGEVFSGREG
jgi:DNA-binding FrmR family transcriptional regulator